MQATLGDVHEQLGVRHDCAALAPLSADQRPHMRQPDLRRDLLQKCE